MVGTPQPGAGRYDDCLALVQDAAKLPLKQILKTLRGVLRQGRQLAGRRDELEGSIVDVRVQSLGGKSLVYARYASMQ